MLETLLYQAYHNPKADYEGLYNIGFTTDFEEVFYGVGYEMAKQLVAHEGNGALAMLVTKDPLIFIQWYIQLYQQQKERKMIRFGTITEDIVSKMMKWEDKT